MFHGVVSEPLLLPTLAVAGTGDAGAHRVVAAVISAHLARRSAWYQQARRGSNSVRLD